MSTNYAKTLLLITFIVFLFQSCDEKVEAPENETPPLQQTSSLQRFHFNDKIKVTIVGTFHFGQNSSYDELSIENQALLEQLTDSLKRFGASKVFLEDNPIHDSIYNAQYKAYLKSDDYIKDKTNEIYQLGFRMAKKLGHDSIYLFDNRPPFIGSLNDFTFEIFSKFKDSSDLKFMRKHYDQVTQVYSYNDSIRKTMPIYDNIKSLNSLEGMEYDIYRMHSIELRAGVNDTWVGADWLGRWYQRNLRMMMHVLQQAEPGDKVIIFVGSNHRWVLEQLMRNTPEFEIEDSFQYM